MENISSCPFCHKGKAIVRRYGSFFFRVQCINCGALGPPIRINHGNHICAQKKAIKKWNERKEKHDPHRRSNPSY